MPAPIQLDTVNGLPVQGTQYAGDYMPSTLGEALNKTIGGGLIAPMPLLARKYPHKSFALTAFSEEICGPDKYGTFGRKEEPVVVTVHGGVDGGGLLTLITLEKLFGAASLGSITQTGAGDLKHVYHGNTDEIFANLLKGDLPEGTTLPVLSYAQFLEEGAPHRFNRYAVVRTLELARCTRSGSIPVAHLTDASGKVTDSQVITYSGGVQQANALVEQANALRTRSLGTWHPFDDIGFDPTTIQARYLHLTTTTADGLVGNASLRHYSRFVGVDKEEVTLLESKRNTPTLEEVMGALRPTVRLYIPNPEADTLLARIERLYTN